MIFFKKRKHKRLRDLVGKILPNKGYTKIDNGTYWPSYKQTDLEWILRYGETKTILEKRMHTALIIAAYRHLIELNDNNRNKICKALREAK